MGQPDVNAELLNALHQRIKDTPERGQEAALAAINARLADIQLKPFPELPVDPPDAPRPASAWDQAKAAVAPAITKLAIHSNPISSALMVPAEAKQLVNSDFGKAVGSGLSAAGDAAKG